MKRLILVLLLLAGMGFVLQGQATEQGNFLIGSQLGLSTAKSKITNDAGSGSSSEESPISTLFSFSPGVGYFLLSEFAIGIRMDYSFNEVKEPGYQQIEDSDLLFGPFARYYYPISKDMALVVEGGFGFGNSNDVQNIGDVNQRINTNIFAVGIGPGLTVFSDSAIGLEAMVKYKYARSDFDTQIGGVQQNMVTKTNKFDISVGIQLYFSGVRKVENPTY